MKVTVASYQAVSILHGGPYTQIHGTVKHLADHGIEVNFFDAWKPFKKTDCDLFHLFAANIGTYHIAREIHALGIPLVVSPIVYSNHSSDFVRRALIVNRILTKLGRGVWSDYGMTAGICSWAHRVLPNTHAEADLLRDGFGVAQPKIAVVPNGVDQRFANADPSIFRKKYGLEGFILNVGHIGHERKNVLALIQALAQIDSPAVIIGRIIRGNYGDACVREASKHKHIVLIDGLEHDSELLASAYAACDVFVLPSLFETPGIAALEAGLAGAKVVVTPYGGTKEYFGDMATYVEPRSILSIRDGITKALNTPQSDGLREHIRNEFLWQRIAERTMREYERALSSPDP